MDEILETAKYIGIVLAEIFLGIYFCKQYIDNITKKIPVGKTIVEQNDTNLDIYKYMNYYKELLKADRILLFEFHNGQHYSSYRSALKMSASYEVYRAGLDSIMGQCTNIPIAIMPNLIRDITTKDYAYCPNIENIKGDMGNSYNFKKSIGVKSYFDLPLHDKDGIIIGFVAVYWTNPIPSHVHLEEDYKDELFHLAWKLEEMIAELTDIDEKMKKKKGKII